MKKLIATATLFGIIIINSATANAGMLMSDLFGSGDTNAPCSSEVEIKVPPAGVDNGIIVKLFGIIVKAAEDGVRSADCTQVDNGILMSD